MLRIHFFRGMGGALTSRGVDEMYQTVATNYPADYVRVWDWDKCRFAEQSLRKHPSHDTVILVGYSMGANAITWLQHWYDRYYALLIGLDPTILSPVYDIQSNVNRAFVFQNINPLNGLIGHATYTRASDNLHTEITEKEITNLHLGVDTDPDNQKIVFDLIDETARKERGL